VSIGIVARNRRVTTARVVCRGERVNQREALPGGFCGPAIPLLHLLH
jgi:hypothetical protein